MTGSAILGGLAVKFATRSAPIDVDLQLPSRTVVEGSAIEVTVRGIARRDVAVDAGEVELIRTVAFNYRQGLTYGAEYTLSTFTTAHGLATTPPVRLPIRGRKRRPL